jgi:hypothetical protein
MEDATKSSDSAADGAKLREEKIALIRSVILEFQKRLGHANIHGVYTRINVSGLTPRAASEREFRELLCWIPDLTIIGQANLIDTPLSKINVTVFRPLPA